MKIKYKFLLLLFCSLSFNHNKTFTSEVGKFTGCMLTAIGLNNYFNFVDLEKIKNLPGIPTALVGALLVYLSFKSAKSNNSPDYIQPKPIKSPKIIAHSFDCFR